MTQGAKLSGLGPVVSSNTRLIVLGSFPGAASLAAAQYYAHPRNHFWRILGALWSRPDLPQLPYPQRLDTALGHGLGLWDVYAACRREGSLDTSIHDTEFNDFARLRTLAPELAAIAHNGGESARAMRFTRSLGLAVYRLPSTSPANASWSFERKLAAWREVFKEYRLA